MYFRWYRSDCPLGSIIMFLMWGLKGMLTGWWFGIIVFVPYIGNVIIPTEYHEMIHSWCQYGFWQQLAKYVPSHSEFNDQHIKTVSPQKFRHHEIQRFPVKFCQVSSIFSPPWRPWTFHGEASIDDVPSGFSIRIFPVSIPQWRPASGNQRKWFNSLGCLGKFGHMVFGVVLFFPKQSENWLKSVTTQSVVGNLLFCILFGVPISSYTWRLWFCCHLCGTNRKLWRCVRSMWRLVVSGYVISRKQSCWRIAMWRMRRLRLVSIFSSHLFRIGKIKTWEDDQSCTDQCMLSIHRQSQSCQRYIKSIRHLKLMSTRVYHSGIQGANADLPNRFFQGGSNVGPVRCFLLYCEVGWVKIKNLNKPWRLLF